MLAATRSKSSPSHPQTQFSREASASVVDVGLSLTSTSNLLLPQLSHGPHPLVGSPSPLAFALNHFHFCFFTLSFKIWMWVNFFSLFRAAPNHNLKSSFNNPEIFSPPNLRFLKQKDWVSFWDCKDSENLKWTAEQGAQTFARQWALCGGEDKRLAAQHQKHHRPHWISEKIGWPKKTSSYLSSK